ncbi:putative MFS-type transporter YwoD [Alicyclobacillus acidoterrestris]|uniref:MFS transporter n=1 Tax=Alicyclobacillus suci TaxID=2816080 RepID=UPI00118F2808|nr:MFS transporter [Alicyclobacillus suci]GEO25433.1 putative MFS-type transporter YwoD [Alicyclobacillus acidoterrestris]
MGSNPVSTNSAIPFKVRNKNLFLITIALGVLLNPLNSSMISVAMARFENVFHDNFDTVSWLISSYYLASAIAQPIMGKLADMLGRKRLFLLGLILVAGSCALAPFSPSFAWLIVFRLIQSLGSGAIYPAGMGIVRNYVTERQSQALAFLAVFSSGAAAFGPSLGGIVMHYTDWPGIFWINFPFIIASFLLAIFILPSDKFSRKEGSTTPVQQVVRQMDIPGIALFAIGIITALVFLLSLTEQITWWALPVAIVAFGLFGWRESRAHTPFLSFSLFRNNLPLTWVLVQFTVVNVVFYSVFFGMPTYLQEARHYDTQQAGLLMLCIAGFSVITSPITGRWVAKSGSRPPLILAGVFMTVGSGLYITLQNHSPVWWLVVVFSVLGLSNGFNNVGLQTALFKVSPKEIISTASGLFQMARYMGTILSTVLLGLLFGQHLSTGQIHILGVILAAIGACVIIMSVRLPKTA